MASLNEPLIDFDNPLYCPEVSAYQFMSSIRLFQASVGDVSRFSYFHRLCLAFDDSPNAAVLKHSPLLPPELCSEGANVIGSFVKKAKKRERGNVDLNTKYTNSLKRHPSILASDSSMALLTRPFKRVRRSSSQVDMSFVLSAKADRLRFSDDDGWRPSASDHDSQEPASYLADDLFWPDGKPDGEQGDNAPTREDLESGLLTACEALKSLEEKFYGSDLGPETPGSLSSIVKRLESLLPGIRLRNQLDMATATHQDIVNLLGIKGHLNPQVLTMFRKAKVYSLNLTESMADADGLNLLRNDTLKVLKSPNSFHYLRKLVLSDVRLSDDDLVMLNDLSRLETLFLDDTQIGDEAIMHLVVLKRSLAHLELSWNDCITDDAIPSLSFISSLSFLSLKGTNITMKGLRRLACAVKNRDKRISLILPSACEEYFCNVDKEYEVNITTPLIHDPAACRALPLSRLKANLAAHAARNGAIGTEGTKGELEKRLRKVLERRQKDMLVQSFMVAGFN